ncbi:MAG TPA: TonB-dependent receptor, partial [Aliidongia sp.]|nr:TonB-dependent receptor [Aliidongia sp.]
TETIEVTGTRIKNADAASANPITVVTSDDIAKTSATTAEDILKKLPSVDFAGGVSSAQTNGGNGDSVVGLRNLGAQRTLVLINGLRMVATDNQTSQVEVDLQNIPVQMIDHIDVLRDGASSIYGADAIGGVINIVLKKHFNGLEFDGDFGITDKSDGMHYGVSSTLGSDFDRGNIIINVSHDHTDPIFQRDRAYSSDQHTGSDFGDPAISSRVPGALAGIGPNKIYFGVGGQSFNINTPPANASSIFPPGIITGVPGGGNTPFFDTTLQQLIQGEVDRNQVNFAGHYDILPNVTAVVDAFYTNRTSQQQLNPEPLGNNVATTKFPGGLFVPQFLQNGGVNLFGPDGAPIPNLANPTVAGNIVTAGGLPIAAQQDITSFLTRRFENGDRFYTEDVDTYRLHAALQGTILDKYDWETGYVFGKSTVTARVFNEVNFEHAAEELGLASCNTIQAKAAGLNGPASDPCLANFFGFNTLTPAQAKYLTFTNTRTSDIEEGYYYGNITGPIYQLPAGPLQASVGFEYRNESTFDQPDSTEVQGDANLNASPSSGSYNVGSGYIELNIPVLKDLPFVKTLNFDVSSRYDYYSSFGRALTYKAGLDWAVTDDFRFRGSNSTGFRAPQVKELFGGDFLNEPSGSDPCDTKGGTKTPSAQCVADLTKAGLNANQIANFSDKLNQISTIQGGNPGLKPEHSQEWTLGGVFTPRWVPGLSVTVDYYTVLIRNAIALANDPLNACETPGSSPSGLADPCAGVIRNPGNGVLISVADPLINFGAENTDGIDIGLSYAFNSDKIGLPGLGGRFAIDGQATYLLSDNQITGGVVTQNAGTYDLNNDTAEPRWKAQLSGTFAKDNWSLTMTERYYGGVKPDQASQSSEGCTEPTEFGCHAPGQFYTDVSGSYDYKNMHVSIGVDNLLDKEPPFIAGGVSVSQTITGGGYDPIGRFIWTKVQIKF